MFSLCKIIFGTENVMCTLNCDRRIFKYEKYEYYKTNLIVSEAYDHKREATFSQQYMAKRNKYILVNEGH